MRFILGIDTGGTFTDTVIWDDDARKVLQKAKAFTVSDNLTQGIDVCMNHLNLNLYPNICEVHLSTTLTVNSILEDRITPIGLITIENHISEKLPVCQKYEVRKEDYIQHSENVQFSSQAARHIRQLFSEKVPIVMVSADGKDRFRTERLVVKALKKLLDARFLCCSQLSSHADFYERTLTAVTSAGLKSTLSRQASSIEATMEKYGLNAPIRMLTGSGSMISLQDAVLRPLDTIMSGSAASFIGSTYLTEEEDYLLLDMGGTSLDITRVENRAARFALHKTPIGIYNYHLEALDLQSFGTGGDSIIKLNSLGDIVVGPQKVTPLCVLGANYPHLTQELRKFQAPEEYDICTAEETACYFISSKCSAIGLGNDQLKILELLSEQPHSLFFIADYFGKDADALHLDQLLEKGCICCASITPTDLLHAEGTFCRWNTAIAKFGTHMLAKRKGCSVGEFIMEVKDFITQQLSFSCMQSIAGFEKKRFLFSDSEPAMYLMEKYMNQQKGLLTSSFSIQKPIVGVGAPAKVWLGEVAQKLGTQLIVPDDGDVASAIGAAAGKVLNNVK